MRRKCGTSRKRSSKPKGLWHVYGFKGKRKWTAS